MSRLLWTLLLLLVSSPLLPAVERPNILLILADDLKYHDLSLTGCEDITTPHLDALAKSGVFFTDAYASAPVCAPSRAGLLTGRNQARFGFDFNPEPYVAEEEGSRLTHPDRLKNGLPRSEKTMATYLQKADYETGWIGKWHLGEAEWAQPKNHGFKHCYGFLTGVQSYFPMTPRQEQLMAGKLNILHSLEDNGKPVKNTGNITDMLGAQTARYISANGKAPWFIYCAFNAPHTPQQPDPEREPKFAHIADANRRKLAANISRLDDAVGVIMKELKEKGQLDRTLVIFASDHGMGANGRWGGGKGTFMDGGLRTPLFVSWPGKIPENTVRDDRVSLLDLAPTILSAAGVQVTPAMKLDGIDLLPALTEEKAIAPRAIAWRMDEGYAFRDEGDWKLVGGASRQFLYDLGKDPQEKQDLAQSKPDKLAELDARWKAWDAENVRPMWKAVADGSRKLEQDNNLQAQPALRVPKAGLENAPLLTLRDGKVVGDGLPPFTPQKPAGIASAATMKPELLQDHYLLAKTPVPLVLSEDGITLACRFHGKGGTLPEGTLFAWKDKQQVLTAVVLRFNGIKCIAALLDSGKGGPLATQRKFVCMPIWEFQPFNQVGWHTLIIRHKGNVLDLFVDGIHRDRHGPKDKQNPYGVGSLWFPADAGSFTSIGADPDDSYHFAGGVTELSVWDSGLDDAALSRIFDQKIVAAEWKRPPDDHHFPKDMTEDAWFTWMDRRMEKNLRVAVNEDKYFPHFHVTGQGDTCNHTLLHDGKDLHLFPGSQSYWWWRLLPLNRSSTGWFGQHWQTSDYLTWHLKPLTQHHGVNGGAEMIDGRISKVGAFYDRQKHESTFYQFAAINVDKRQWQLTTSTIPGQPGLKTGVRDCDVFQHEGWYYLVGGNPNHWPEGAGGEVQKGKNTRYFLHKSRDLKTWETAGNGIFWDAENDMTTECPSVNFINGRCVMLGCQNLIGKEHYAVGDFQNERFVPKKFGQVDVCNAAAAHSWMTQDDKGRWILTTWLRGSNMGGRLDTLTGVKPRFQAGWHTVYSLPREVTVRDDYSLAFTPLSDLAKLREKPASLTDVEAGAMPVPISTKPGAYFEVEAEWKVVSGVTSGIRLDQGGEHIDITHTPENGGALVFSTEGARLALAVSEKVRSMPLPRKAGEKIKLRVFFDACIIEIYTDNGRVMTGRWYAKDPQQMKASLISQNGNTRFTAAHYYPIRSIWAQYQATPPEAKP